MIRLYGTSRGYGSFARVTAGMRGALERIGAFAGLVPTDAYDPEDEYPGWDAPVGVYVGNPVGCYVMTGIARHAKRFVLLPPNSSWMPDELLDHVAKSATHLVAPSTWALDVQSQHTTTSALRLTLWQHGIDSGFRPNMRSIEAARASFREGHFAVAHLTSSALQRKGTKELIDGWLTAVRENRLGPKPILSIIADGWAATQWASYVDATAGVRPERATIVVEKTVMRGGMPVDAAAEWFGLHHVICQPSRGEGFGLVPLEARASGVPVVATACTGHHDHVRPCPPGVVIVEHGSDSPIDDGPGAFAPSVAPVDIVNALEEAYGNWPPLSEQAVANTTNVRERWNWDTVTRAWIDRYDILGKG